MAGIRRKLKAKDEFFGRLFPTQEKAEEWIERIRHKMGQGYTFGTEPWSDEDGELVVGYLYKGKE